MTFQEIKDTIENQFKLNSIKYKILVSEQNRKLINWNFKNSPPYNILIEIELNNNKKMLFIDINYQKNKIFKIKQNNKFIIKEDVITGKSSRDQENWFKSIPEWLSNFQDALYVKIAEKFEMDEQKNWRSFMRVISYNFLRSNKFIELLK